MKSKKIALFPNHPSQIWVLNPVADFLNQQDGVEVIWFIRDKDVSVDLARNLEINAVVVSRARTGFIGNGIELFINVFKCVYYTLRFGIDVWVTKYGCGSMAAFLLGRKAVAFNDDDADVVPLIAATSYPFSKTVLVPEPIRMKKYEGKAQRYNANHELFYLHPNRFRPNPKVLEELGLADGEPFGLIRLSALEAHHDVGVEGVSGGVVREVIGLCSRIGFKVFITSEKPLEREFEPYRLNVSVEKIHHVLYFARFLVGDSQTMIGEAAALGTPSFRLSDFGETISCHEDLKKHGLSFAYKPHSWREMLDQMERVLCDEDFYETHKKNHEMFLKAKMDPVPWFAEKVLEVLRGHNVRQRSKGPE